MTPIEAANKAGFSQTALLLKNAELKFSGKTVRSASPVAA
jgi:hypothetical protein